MGEHRFRSTWSEDSTQSDRALVFSSKVGDRFVKKCVRRDRRDVAKRFSFTTIRWPYGMRLATRSASIPALPTPMRSSMAALPISSPVAR